MSNLFFLIDQYIWLMSNLWEKCSVCLAFNSHFKRGSSCENLILKQLSFCWYGILWEHLCPLPFSIFILQFQFQKKKCHKKKKPQNGASLRMLPFVYSYAPTGTMNRFLLFIFSALFSSFSYYSILHICYGGFRLQLGVANCLMLPLTFYFSIIVGSIFTSFLGYSCLMSFLLW